MNDFSLPHLWQQMGPVPKGVVIILLLMSTYSIGVAVERLLAFRRGRNQSIGYIGALQPLIATPGRLREAVGLEQRWRASPVARVIASGISEFVRGVEGRRRRALPLEGVVEGASRSMERIKERELINLRRGLPGLATVSSSAPFVGLLGTVFGIITAFQKMSESTGGGLASVSGGIAEALITTAVGLTVAIVSVWFYNFFTNKVDHITVDVDETAGEVLECMIRDGEEPVAASPNSRAHAWPPALPQPRERG
jgi:biopolymer transport protein ExbB/TolQ